MLFGLIVGGVGVATAGIGIGIPMIPLGAYLAIRGGRNLYLRNNKVADAPAFERTRLGGALFGILLVFVGIAASALVIGIPIAVGGVALTVYSLWPRGG